jgi:acyl transferase domain-containing protein
MGETGRTIRFVADFSRRCRSGVLRGTFFGEGRRLHEDLPAQVGVFAVSVAALDVLERVHGLLPTAVAGYSLGTFAAFVAAGALDRLEALDIVLTLQRLLEEHRLAFGDRPGGMGFVIGWKSGAGGAHQGHPPMSEGSEETFP